MKLKAFLTAAALLAPTAALAAPGIVTASVSMRAGPGPGFPMVDRIPDGSHVNIHGCIRGDAWCDVSWTGDRGWVSARYLEYLYHDRYVYLPDYVSVIDVPIVPFEIGSYWSTYYAGRPWYHRRAYWEGYWRSHERYAYEGLGSRAGRFGTAETRTGVTEHRTGPGVTTGVAGRQGAANVRGEQGRMTREQGRMVQGRMAHEQERTAHEQGRMAHMNGANRNFSHAQAPMTRGHEANHFGTAPHANAAMHAPGGQPHGAPTTIGRAGGPTTNAHAQMSGGHGPAMPHGGGGAPAQMGGGGGGHAGGPPGEKRH
jgi:uncharacterized protein YraI